MKCPIEAGSKLGFSGLGQEERQAENVLESDNGDGCMARECSESHCRLHLKILNFAFCEFHPNKENKKRTLGDLNGKGHEELRKSSAEVTSPGAASTGQALGCCDPSASPPARQASLNCVAFPLRQ